MTLEVHGDWVSLQGFTFAKDTTQNVFDAALERMRHMFALTPHLIISFSGGKDSTCVLMLALQVARELNRLPLEVAFIDEEVIDPDTVAYVTQLREWPELSIRWFCVPIRHTLRSNKRTHWYTWDPEHKEVWARDLPAGAITQVDGLDDDSSYDNVIENYYMALWGNFNGICATGVRMQEAFNRRRQFVATGDYIVKREQYVYAKPIYDWTTDDVWKAIVSEKWPHSAFYDKLWMKGSPLHLQRVAPWGNVAQREVIFFPEFYPDFWERAIRRLPELRPAQRYRMSKIYREVMDKPAGLTWQEFALILLERLEPESKAYWKKTVANTLRRIAKNSTQPLPEDSKTFLSWKRVCALISKNDRMHGSSRDRT